MCHENCCNSKKEFPEILYSNENINMSEKTNELLPNEHLKNENLKNEHSHSKHTNLSNCCHVNIHNDINKIFKIMIIIIIFMLIELWGHFRTNSLSLLADALHLVVDVSGFLVSLVTLKISKRKPNSKYNFGYQRYEIMGALISVVLIWIAVGYLICESFHKFIHPKEIDGKVFVGIAVVGLIVNLICISILHSSHGSENTEILENEMQNNKDNNKNLNIRATYIHIIGDIIQSLGVILASIIIYFYPSLVIFDVLCTLFFAILVIGSTTFIVRDACVILTEGCPSGINYKQIKNKLLEFNKVLKVKDLKIWSIGANKIACTVTLSVDYIHIKEYEELLKSINNYIRSWKIDVLTIQIEVPE